MIIDVNVAKKTDIKYIADIEKSIFKDYWGEETLLNSFDNNQIKYWVAKIDEEIVGYVALWILIDEGHITNIAVLEEYRKKGVGRKLIAIVKKEMEELNLSRITLEVRKSNLVAQNMYNSEEFEVEGIRPKYYNDNGEDAVIMSYYGSL